MPDSPDRYELVARMKYVEGKTWAQIGRELEIPSTSLTRISKQIRRDMKLALKIIVIVRQFNVPKKR